MCVCVLDSSKCHGISHGNASQRLMSAPLFPKLSGQRRTQTHTHAHVHMCTHTCKHRHMDGKGYVNNCQDDGNNRSYLFYETLIAHQHAAFWAFKQSFLSFGVTLDVWLKV